MNLRIITKNIAADSKIGSPHKIDFRADWTHESNPTAWELSSILIEFTIGQLIQVPSSVLQYLQEGLDYSRDTRGPDFPIFIQKNNAMIRDSRISEE